MPYYPKHTQRRGMGQANLLCSLGILASDSATCSSLPAQPASAPPVLAPGSISPSTPAGYDPNTGLITGNPSGATTPNPFQATIPQLDSSGNPIQPATPNWFCTNMGLFCGTPGAPSSGLFGVPGWAWAIGGTLAAVVALGAVGGRR